MIIINRIILTGRLTSQPELKYTQSNKAYCHFCIAVKGYQDKTDFVNCEVWDKQAENLNNYQEKGNLILVEGRLSISTYEKNGEKRVSTSITCNNIEYLESKKKEQEDVTDPYTFTRNRETRDPFSDFGDNVSITNDFLD